MRFCTPYLSILVVLASGSYFQTVCISLSYIANTLESECSQESRDILPSITTGMPRPHSVYNKQVEY